MFAKILLGAWLSACSADATTTHIALNHGAREVLLTQNPWINDGIVAGVALSGVGINHVLRREGHPRMAIVTMLAITAMRSAVAIHNARVIGELR